MTHLLSQLKSSIEQRGAHPRRHGKIRFTCQRAAETLADLGPASDAPTWRHPGPGARLAPGRKPDAPVHSRTTVGCVWANKKPHRAGRVTRARWGPDRGPEARRYVTAAPSEPIPPVALRLVNRPNSTGDPTCEATLSNMSAAIADTPMRSATAAFAGAVLGIDVCIAHMIGPGIHNWPAQLWRERVSTGNGVVRQERWKAPR
jgi:hypothetical protein